MKQKVKIFVSYAHRNKELAKKFIEQFKDHIAPSKSYEYIIWDDLELKVGEKWNAKILDEINKCDCGLLLISTSFLNSNYITTKELPALLNKNKLLIPVVLSKINFDRHDLKGLEEYQMYRLFDEGFKEPRSYSELKPKRRFDFIDGLFIQMEELLDKHFRG